jgi:hypothetical protein
MLQAEREWAAGAQGHGLAVKAALDKVAPDGLETPWQWRSLTPFSSQARPVGGGAPRPAAPAARPSQAATELPPAARARLKEGVVTTFGNGQKWTLTDGVPARVQ